MAMPPDSWIVRLPDGRVFRSRNTATLVNHVRKGRVPRGSRVRRAAARAWQVLEEVGELAAALPGPSANGRDIGQANGQSAAKAPDRPRSRADFSAWRSVGVRGLMRELMDALDSGMQRSKLGLACLLGVLAGVSAIAGNLIDVTLDGPWWTAATTGLAVFAILAGGGLIALITQITFINLSRLHTPHREELWPWALGHAVRLGLALLLVVGAGVGVILALRSLPAWMADQAPTRDSLWHYGAAAVLIARLVLEVLFWPMLALAPLLLSPILVVEECSVPRALLEWWSMLRKHLGRIFLYEALAAAFAIVLTAPLVVPIVLANWSLGDLHGPQLIAAHATLAVLAGIALTPLLAYLLVANVFIYLNLRYEFFHSQR